MDSRLRGNDTTQTYFLADDAFEDCFPVNGSFSTGVFKVLFRK
jgi:hypothetical protein